jgi:hypothetical protein
MKMPRIKATLLTIFLGAVLTVSMPAPAHADGVSLGSIFSGLMSGLQSIVSGLTGLGQSINTTLAQAFKIKNDADIKRSDFQADATQRAAQNGAAADITRTTENPPDIACQVAANMQDEYARQATETKLQQDLASVLSHVYVDKSGTSIGKAKIIKALCALGATGKKAECDKEESDALVKKMVEGGDWNVTNTVIQNECIPFDFQKVETELNNIATQDNYTLSNQDMKEAMIALLSIRVNRGLDISAMPGKKENETVSGQGNSAALRSIVSQILASSNPILRAYAWNACFTTSLMPNCRTDNSELIRLLTAAKAPDMPAAGFCISGKQKNDGEITYFEDQLRNGLGKVAGTANETFMSAMELRKAIKDNRDRHDRIWKDASKAAESMPVNTQIGSSAKPTAENDIQELKDSIRKLTRAIEQTNQRYPRAQDARLTPPSGDGALPPLRQDFPIVP